ncbi:MAG: GntR family transcriptional regulator [bacterium]|nr:GntR family transcriptional regulator [bacterium]
MQDIRHGKYAFGSALPSEPRLAEDYGISRQTVRQALKELETEGYLLRERGRGTFVARLETDNRARPLNIGVVIYKPALEAQWFLPDLFRGISDAVNTDSANIIIIPFDEDTPGVHDGLFCRQIIERRDLHGLILVGEELRDSEVFYLLSRNYPFLSAEQPPTAMLLADDGFASGIYKATAQKGIKVPEDLSIIGFNDLPIAEALSLTTIRVPRYEIGHRASEIIRAKIAAAASGSRAIERVELVIRNSCSRCCEGKPAAGEDKVLSCQVAEGSDVREMEGSADAMPEQPETDRNGVVHVCPGL